MLRLQQYEQLMKRLLANHELEGTPERWEAERSARVDGVATDTLGVLVNKLFEMYIVEDGKQREPAAVGAPGGAIVVRVSHRLTMSAERREQTRASIKELLALRNGLVHHFVQRFDLSSDEGCRVAADHLEDCCDRIGRRHEELVAWAKSMAEADALMASILQSDTFHDMLVSGIAPDGSFVWADTGIVRVLREANLSSSVDGWTRLDEALVSIALAHPEETPTKYYCRTWPQVLSESKLFRVEYRRAHDGRRLAWFRQNQTR